MNLHPATQIPEKKDGELPPEMFAELVQALEDPPPALRVQPVESRMIDAELQGGEDFQDLFCER